MGKNDEVSINAEMKRQSELGLADYVIQWGDTLGVISQVTGKSIDDIAAVNDIKNINLIFTGDLLKGLLADYNVQKESVTQDEGIHNIDNLIVEEQLKAKIILPRNGLLIRLKK